MTRATSLSPKVYNCHNFYYATITRDHANLSKILCALGPCTIGRTKITKVLNKS